MAVAKKKPVPAKPSREVATKSKNEVSNVNTTMLLRKNAGKGVSTASEDNIIPLIYILQAQSKQCLPQKPECIKPGIDGNKTAVAGNIWPRGTKTLIDGEAGLPVIVCAVRKFWTEWKPDRGGFAGKHEYLEREDDKGRPDDAEEVKDPKTGFSKWVRENGNELTESREHAVLAEIDGTWGAYVIAMKGSDHSMARQWNGARLRARLPAPDDDFVPPAFTFVYTLKTIAKTNDLGDWYGWTYENAGDDNEAMETSSLRNGEELLQMSVSLCDAFMSGMKQAEEEQEINVGGDDHGDL